MQLRSSLASTPAKRRFLAQAAACAALVLAGCGGGGDAGPASGGTGSGGTSTSSFASGPISGFGSIIVNGVRFDDSNATVKNEDGSVTSRGALKLGMSVEVHGGGVSDDGSGPRASASQIQFGAELVGPVDAIDATAKSVSILGQTVLVLDTTVIDDQLVGGFAAVTVGMALEVHGSRDVVTGVITATRIGRTLATSGFRIRGPVANLDATAKTFTIAGAPINYAGLVVVPADLANGIVVRVRVQTPQVNGAWVATRLDDANPHVGDADRAELKGSVTAITSIAAFSVNGIAVDATNAAFPHGSTGLVLGAQVEVAGTSVNGVVVASRVEVKTPEEQHAEGFEVHGAITSVDTVAKTFGIRGVTVSYAGPAIDYRKGGEAQLVVGAQIEVRGVLSADGTMLQATRISFGD